MKKIYVKKSHSTKGKVNKTWLVMNYIFIFLFLGIIHVSAHTYSQQTRLSLKYNQVSFEKVIKEIKKDTEFDFIYDSEQVSKLRPVSVIVNNEPVESVLSQCLEGTNLDYRIKDNVILIVPRETNPQLKKKEQPKPPVVTGKVYDESNVPLPGVNVTIKGSSLGVITDKKGNYSIELPSKDIVLVYSFIGMITEEVKYTDQTSINITLETDIQGIDEIVVTGYFNANKDSYTGTATTVKGEDVLKMGGGNLVENLSLASPSLQLVDNNLLGSNPNALPELRLRGESVLSAGSGELSASNLLGDPNQPLFILDNFQTTLEQVLDLDQTRIQSITILRDASATAIYGSRAANGVIVIKTKQPEEGKLQVIYNVFTDISIADVESYDLLNGKELFELQNQLGMRSETGVGGYEYREIQKNIASGVETDWLAQPVRNAVGQRHSLNLSGGDSKMRYGLDLNYSDNPGVMKESGRETYSIAATLQYNANDKLTFRNRLETQFNNTKESPYGNFSYYARIPSYLPVKNLNGGLTQIYEYEGNGYSGDFTDGSSSVFYNPLYEAQAGNINESSANIITNNFEIIWNINSMFRFNSNVSFSNQLRESEIFRSPFSIDFYNVLDVSDRGRYTKTNTKTQRIDGSATLNFNKDIAGHMISANLGANIQNSVALRDGFTAYGYATSNPDPAFSKGYQKDGFPTSEEATTRLAGVFATMSYTYKERYLIDGSYRLDGSSVFGSSHRFAPFYSMGIGWNLHNEEFFGKSGRINSLRLRATYGETGAVSFSPYQALTTLKYYSDYRYLNDVGTYALGVGNEQLMWQTTENVELGIDLMAFKGFVSAQLGYYVRTTTDMVTEVSTPPSQGFPSFVANLGQLENKGFEISLRSYIYKKEGTSINVFATAFQNKNKILGISESLDYFNDNTNSLGYTEDQLREINELGSYIDENGERIYVDLAEDSHNFLLQYQEGGSENDIYAVQSLGIDPMTGQEFFLSKDGIATTTWSSRDKVKVGNTEPKLRGTFGFNAAYKGFTLNVIFNYSYGGQIYNQTLVDKVENSDKFGNVDRRVLTDSWRKPGDVVEFKPNVSVSSSGFVSQTSTFASSRFVQDYNYLRLGSVGLTYDVPGDFSETLKMKSLRISFNMNEMFYTSTVKQERGTSYPFARQFTFGLRANF